MKTLLIMAFLGLFAVQADAFTKTGGGNVSTVGTIADETGLAYSRSFGVSPGQYGGKEVSVVVVYTSATFSNVVFSTNAITMGSGNITAASHGYTTGLPVLLRETAGTVPGPLVAETTYYAIPYSANVVQLATTSAQAQASDPILFVSSTNTGAQTYTLIPLAITGTPSFKWQGSNNGGLNVVDLDIQAISITEYTLGGAVVGFDFDDFNYTDLIMNVTAPTTGGLYLKAYANIKE